MLKLEIGLASIRVALTDKKGNAMPLPASDIKPMTVGSILAPRPYNVQAMMGFIRVGPGSEMLTPLSRDFSGRVFSPGEIIPSWGAETELPQLCYGQPGIIASEGSVLAVSLPIFDLELTRGFDRYPVRVDRSSAPADPAVYSCRYLTHEAALAKIRQMQGKA